MKSKTLHASANLWRGSALVDQHVDGVGDWLGQCVDVGLVGVIGLAPYFFGGRHDFGRLIFVVLVAATAIAWFLRQALRPTTAWKDTAAYVILLLAIGLLIVQIVHLPAAWLEWLAPRHARLLPLWQSSHGNGATLGSWSTISFVPHETTKALALLVAYSLLFVVVVQRIESVADIQRILRWIGISAVAMAAFGLIQYFTANGLFFWFYEHPHRSTYSYVCGSFMNRNHFANFLVLGAGPLAAWLLESIREQSQKRIKNRRPLAFSASIVPLLLGIALAIVLFAIMLSLSRGGTMALITAVVVTGFIYARSGLVDTRYLALFVGLTVVVLGLLSVNGYDEVARRLNTLTQGSMEAVDRNQGRRKIWNANLAAIQDGGLAGAGAGSHSMIYPIYLPESIPGEYTHAENGYLQVATETGAIGAVLLLAGMGLCGSWCLTCLCYGRSEMEQLCFGAVCGGLAASAVHSIVDFVWYIPACMSVTVVLAGCALRLANLAASGQGQGASGAQPLTARLSFGYRFAAPIVAATGVWMVWTFVGPGIASIHWDRYLRVSVANANLSEQTLKKLVDNLDDAPIVEQNRAAMLQSMLRHLECAVAWDPDFAAARITLATNQVNEFERRQRTSANAMGVAQVRDAAFSSLFKSQQELRGWLERAFGEDCQLLELALENAHAGLASSPLSGDGYLALADLCFLEGAGPTRVAAYIDQGLRVRPYDGDLLFEVGKQAMASGDVEGAMRQWTKCFGVQGDHQLKIVYLLAGRIPAAVFIDGFHPDWHTLPGIWARYRELGQPQDLVDLIVYSAGVAERQVRENDGIPAGDIWL